MPMSGLHTYMYCMNVAIKRNETEEEISKQGIKIVIYIQIINYISFLVTLQKSMIETSKYALKSDKFRELVSMIRTCTTKSLIRETNRKF